MNKKTFSLQYQLVIWTGIFSFLIIIMLVIVAIWDSSSAGLRSIKSDLISIAEHEAASIDSELEVAMDTSRTLASTFSINSTSNSGRVSRVAGVEILRTIMEDNPNFLGIYTSWEPNQFDGKDEEYKNKEFHDGTGLYTPYWTMSDSKLSYEIDTNYDGEYYTLPKKTLKEQLIEPYPYPVQGKEVLMTSVVVPVVENGTFLGIAGIDLALSFLQEFADKLDLYDKTGKMIVVSNSGLVACATGSPELIGKKPASMPE